MSNENKPKLDKETFWNLLLSNEVPFFYKAIFVGGLLLYLLSPIDLIPEALFGPLGIADDAGVALFAAQMFTKFSNGYLQKKHDKEQAAMATHAPQQGFSAQAAHAPQSPTQQQSPQPHLPAHHLQAHGAPPTPNIPQGDMLNDEYHERLLREKSSRSQDEFENLLRKNRPNSHE